MKDSKSKKGKKQFAKKRKKPLGKKAPKIVFSMRIPALQNEVIEELSNYAGLGITLNYKELTKSDWFQLSFSFMLECLLGGLNGINEKQLDSYREDPNELSRLFIMWSRALQGVKGYGFSTKDPETRFVYGPKPETSPHDRWLFTIEVQRDKKKE